MEEDNENIGLKLNEESISAKHEEDKKENPDLNSSEVPPTPIEVLEASISIETKEVVMEDQNEVEVEIENEEKMVVEVQNEEDKADKKVEFKSTRAIQRQAGGLGALLAQMKKNVNPVEKPALQKRSLPHSEPEVVPKLIKPSIPSPSYSWLTTLDPTVKQVYASEHLIQTVSKEFSSGTTPKFYYAKNISENNYVRSSKFSPDGKFLLTDSVDRRFRVFDVNENDELTLKHEGYGGGLIYDTIWDPYQRFFATTSTGCPIHLWSVDSGKQIATFRGIDHLDLLEHAHALDVNHDGTKIYASYRAKVRRFDLNRPGKQYSIMKTFTKKLRGISTILPAIQFSPSIPNVFAVGSFNYSVGIYSDQTNSCDILIATECKSSNLLKYSSDGQRIYIGGVGSNFIETYDIRMPTQCWSRYARKAENCQKIYFDISSDDKYLFTGSTDGIIHMFDLQKPQLLSFDSAPTPPDLTLLNASAASVTGCSLNKARSLLATSHGQRVYPTPLVDNEPMFESDHEGYMSAKLPFDNTVKLWRL